MNPTTRFATCLGCGCTCTDIAVTLAGDRFSHVETDCRLGRDWLGDGQLPDRVLLDAADVSLEQALDAVAELLTAVPQRVLVYVADDVGGAAQGAATALADQLRASIDGPTSDTVAGGLLAAQRRGRASATLGELRHRADVVVFWGVDPDVRYPRFIERFVSGAPAFAPARRLIAIDVGECAGPACCDERLTVAPDREVDALTTARAVVHGRPSPTEDEDMLEVIRVTQRLMDEARYIGIVFDAEPGLTTRDPDLAEALVAFTQSLNARSRASLFALRSGGNRSGFESLLTWQTGFPFSVDFAGGAPRYDADDTASQRLARGRFDAVLVAGSTRNIPSDVAAALRSLPTVIIGPRASETTLSPRVAIDTGAAAIHEEGLVLRMDDVPLEPVPLLSHRHGTQAILRALATRTASIPAGAR